MSWYGFELIRKGRPPSGDAMDVYLSKLERLRRDNLVRFVKAHKKTRKEAIRSEGHRGSER